MGFEDDNVKSLNKREGREFVTPEQRLAHVEGVLSSGSLNKDHNKGWQQEISQGRLNLNFIFWASREVQNIQNSIVSTGMEEAQKEDLRNRCEAALVKLGRVLASFDD